jgi:tetratricopeptide (TPR) repeat protein/curved DNA-binding protein CbpA
MGQARDGDALERQAMKTHYEVLGVPRHADDKAIRAAFRRAAKVHHPDLNAGDKDAELSFRQIVSAYEVLKDPQQRGAYDLSLRKRRFGMTASVLAGLISGAGLVAIVWLSRTTEPSPQSPHMAIAEVAEPRNVAAVDDVVTRQEETKAAESALAVAATDTDQPEKRPQHGQQLANSEGATTAGADVRTPQTPMTSELQQAQANRGPMGFWVFVVRNPDIFQGELGRSELLQLIDAADDVRLLRALSMGGNGAIAGRARQRLIHLVQATIAQGTEVAGSHVGEGGATASTDPGFYLARCMRHFRQGNFDQAIADCDEAVRLEPGKAQAYGRRGNAWAGKGEVDRAQADYEAAIRIDPHNPELLREQGVLWRKLGDLDRALAAFDHAIRLGFSDASAYNERGLVWLQKGRYERGIADFNQALKIDPELVGALINRGIAWRSKGALDRAIADFGQVISVDPNLPAAYYYRGLARTEKQDIELAMADFAKAWELLPNALSSAHLQ